MFFRALGILLLLALPAMAKAAELSIQIDRMEAMEGTVRIALYDREDDWLTSRALAARVVELKEHSTLGEHAQIVVTFKNLPAGPVAVAAYHDRNADGHLDTGFLGLPSEPMGFSAPHFWKVPPDFEDAVISLEEVAPTRIVVHLN